jgi:hypothetical protein
MFPVVILWSVTVEAWVRFQGSPCGFCGRQSSTGTSFSVHVCGFPISIVPLKCRHLFVTPSSMAYQ